MIGKSIPLNKIYPYPYDRFIGHKIGPVNRVINRQKLNSEIIKGTPRGVNNLSKFIRKHIGIQRLGYFEEKMTWGEFHRYRHRECDKKYYANCDDWWLKSIGREDLVYNYY